MPAFRWMAQDDLEAVIDYVMSLSSRGEVEFLQLIDAEHQMLRLAGARQPFLMHQPGCVQRSLDQIFSSRNFIVAFTIAFNLRTRYRVASPKG